MIVTAEVMRYGDIGTDSRNRIWAAQSDPLLSYASYIAAVARRDLDNVLAHVSDSYGRGLRRLRGRSSFMAFFSFWCESYPLHREVVACFIDGDTAILETVGEGDGATLSARVALIHDGETWRVDSERCADGRARIPTPRLAPRKLA